MKQKIADALGRITAEHKKMIFIIICAVIGLSMAIFPRHYVADSQTNTTDTADENDYVHLLESRLSETVSLIDGAGKSKVLITLASSGETVYLTNARLDESTDTLSQSRVTSEKQLATMKNGTYAESPVVVKELAPKISGVLIICEGGENQNVKNNIIKATSTALDVSSSRIYVTGGNFP